MKVSIKGGLYKGKYLIALYDLNDNLIDVATSVSKLYKFNSWSSLNHKLNYKNQSNRKMLKVYLIDCTEKHNDCFKEEDELFLFEIKTKTDKQIAFELGISLRQYYRRKKYFGA